MTTTYTVSERSKNLLSEKLDRLTELFAEIESGNLKVHKDASNILYQLLITTGVNRSLYAQNMLLTKMLDSRGAMNAENKLPEFALLLVYGTPTGHRAASRLGKTNTRPAVKLSKWLSDIAIRLPNGRHFSRNQIISIVRNKDGGAHSDPNITMEADYEYNKEVSAAYWTLNVNGKPEDVFIKSAFAHSIHQMCYEVLVSIERMQPLMRAAPDPIVTVSDPIIRPPTADEIAKGQYVTAPPNAAYAKFVIGVGFQDTKP